MVRNEAPARAKAAGERQLPNDLSLPRQSSTLLAGSSGWVTKAVMAVQSLSTSRASARTFSAASSRWRLQARFRRARRGLTMRASALSDLVDEAAHLAQQPRSEVGALGVEATGQRYSLADQMGQTSLALLGSDGPDISGPS